MNTFNITIVTPEQTVYSGEIFHLRARNGLGSFGILARHAPFITALESGDIIMNLPDGTKKNLAISGGYLKFLHNKCLILVEALKT